MTRTIIRPATKVCANPQCGKTFPVAVRPGGVPAHCSAKCRNAVSWARYTGRKLQPPSAVKTRAEQLRAYFGLLMRLAEHAEDKQRRDDLFDRIERTLCEIGTEEARLVPSGLGWP